MMKIKTDAFKSIDELNKSDVVEMKAIRAAQAMELVGESVCILFNKKPSYASFKKIAFMTDFMQSLKMYDMDTVSDYALAELKKYIENPLFNEEYMTNFSNMAKILCQWVISVNKYAILKNSVS